MADSVARRIKRHNMHKSGNHTICRPQFCQFARLRKEREEPEGDHKVQDGYRLDVLEYEFGPEAQTFWESLSEYGDIDALVEPLAMEVCRTIDRMRKLDQALRNKTNWLRFRSQDEQFYVDDHGGTTTVSFEYKIIVDSALRETREQLRTLTSAISELRQLFAEQNRQKGHGSGQIPPAPTDDFLGGLQDELAKRRKPMA